MGCIVTVCGKVWGCNCCLAWLATNQSRVPQRNARMLHMLEQALEHETSAPAHCLAMMGRSADRVIDRWHSNPEGLAAVCQDVSNHNAAFDRSATVHSHFRGLVRLASAAAAAAAA